MSKLAPKAVITHDSLVTSWTVRITYPNAGVDRPSTYGISTGPDYILAQRLAAAVDAGVVVTGQRILRDVNGATYVEARCNVRGRALNADLRRLGF